jgi:hypothetical protein
MRLLAILLLMLLSVTAGAANRPKSHVLVTPQHRITVWLTCADLDVNCTLVGHVYDLGTRQSSELYGVSAFAPSCQSHVPCHTGSVIYRLSGLGRTYLLYPSGELLVQDGERVLARERGSWLGT